MPMRPSASRRLIVRSERTTLGFLPNALAFGSLSVLTPVDRNDRRRRRRRASPRRSLIRRFGALAIVILIGAGFAFGAHSLTGGGGTKQAAAEPDAKPKAALAQATRRAVAPQR